MHMSLDTQVQAYLADKDATWANGAATWTADGAPRMLLTIHGAPSAAALVDAHARARAAGARLIVAHSDGASPVALRTAARFGLELLHLAPPAEAPAEELVIAPSEPAPEVAHADVALPWDLSASRPEPEPVHVEAAELLAMPWNLVDDQHELLPAGRSHDRAPTRPTAIGPDWGLPWPRPVPPADAIAKVDPTLWHARDRLRAVRDDLDAVGAPSFGAAKPEGSAWLRRITEFGGP